LRHPLQHRGYSIIETLTAVVILTIGLLGVLGALTFALRATACSGTTTDAVNRGREIFEQVRQQNLADPSLAGMNDGASVRRPINDAPFNTLSDNPSLRRNITTTNVLVDNTLKARMVRVRVFFFDRGAEKNVEICGTVRLP
jgi:Tfp pilus assembly protein PilV